MPSRDNSRGDTTHEAQRMGAAINKRTVKTAEASPKRPERSEEISSMMLEFTLNVRKNIASLIECEQTLGVDDPLTLHQLGKMAGFKSSVIYQNFTSEEIRNNIGIQLIARLAVALNTSVYTLMLPHDQFVSDVLPGYRESRLRAERGRLTPTRNASRNPKKGGR